MKRFLLFTAILMVFITSRAYDFESGGLYYNVVSSTNLTAAVAPVNVNDNSAYKGIFIIPSAVTYNGNTYKITQIAKKAFYKSGATEVFMPNTITAVGDSAFALSESLTSITLSTALKSVPRYMLANTAITAIAIPEGVKTLGYGSFQTCTQLQSVYLPSTVTLLDAYALNGCTSLTSIYCAAPTPPTLNWAALYGPAKCDVILVDSAAVDAYSKDVNTDHWGDTNVYTLYVDEPVSLSMTLSGDKYENNWIKLPLGDNFCYKVYSSDDDYSALYMLTAADNVYLPILDHKVTYAVVPTSMMHDGDAMYYTVDAAAIDYILVDNEEEHPNIYTMGGNIYISGDNFGKWVWIYDVFGRLYYEEPAINVAGEGIQLPGNRVYIVRVGNYVKKVFL
jgi:hypothetical protein